VGRGNDDCYEQTQVLTIDFLIRGWDGGAIGPTPYFGFGDETGPKPWQLCGGNLLNGKSYRFTFRTADQGKDDYPRRFDFGDPSQAKGWQAGALEVNLKDATVFAWMNGRSIPVALNYGTHDKAGATFPGEPVFTPGLSFQSNDPGAPMNVWAYGSMQDSWGASVPPAQRGSFWLGGLRFTSGKRYATDARGNQVLAPGVAGTLNDDFRYTANQDRSRCLFALDTTKGPAGTVADRWARCQAGPNLTTFHGLFCPATEDVLYNVTVNQTIRDISLESGANGHAGLVVGKFLTFTAKDCHLQGGWHGFASSGGIGPNSYTLKLLGCRVFGWNSWVYRQERGSWSPRPTDYRRSAGGPGTSTAATADRRRGRGPVERRRCGASPGTPATRGPAGCTSSPTSSTTTRGSPASTSRRSSSSGPRAGVRLDVDGFAPGSQPPGIPTVLLIDRYPARAAPGAVQRPQPLRRARGDAGQGRGPLGRRPGPRRHAGQGRHADGDRRAGDRPRCTVTRPETGRNTLETGSRGRPSPIEPRFSAMMWKRCLRVVEVAAFAAVDLAVTALALGLLGLAVAWIAGAGPPGTRCPVVVTTFGAIPDDGLDDLPAFVNATAAAQARGVALEVPPGKFNLVYRPGTPNMIPVAAGRLKVVGAGRGLTVLQFGPERPTGPDMINVWDLAEGVDAEFTDLTIAGPADPGPNGSGNTFTNAFHCPGATRPGSLKLSRVDVTGNLLESIELEAGTGLATYLCELRDCSLSNASQNIAFFGPDGGDRQLRCFNVTFGHSGLYPGDPGYPWGHGVYIHPCNSYLFESCRWTGAEKLWLQSYSGGGRTAAPAYQVLRDCYVGPGCVGGAFLGPLGVTQWGGGGYYGTGTVMAQGTLVADAIDFRPRDTAFVVEAGDGASVSFSGCQLGNYFRAEAARGRWNFFDCVANRGVAGSTQLMPIQAIGGDVLVRGGRYTGGTPPQVSTPAVYATAGRLAIDGATFDGTYDLYPGTPAVQLLGTVAARVDRSRFDGPSVPIACDPALPAGSLAGTGNLFLGPQPAAPGQSLTP
jgi:hypothetical protein